MSKVKRKKVAVLPEEIRSYMERHKLSQQAFAEQIGVTQGLVWQWLAGRTGISAEKAIEIERKTGGEITRRSLRPDIFEERAA